MTGAYARLLVLKRNYIMENKSYSEKLKDPRWQKKRLEIFDRDKWTCRYCGETERTLHIHHTKYVGEPWEAPNDTLETVCEACHLLIEGAKKWVLSILFIRKIYGGDDALYCAGVGDNSKQMLMIFKFRDHDIAESFMFNTNEAKILSETINVHFNV